MAMARSYSSAGHNDRVVDVYGTLVISCAPAVVCYFEEACGHVRVCCVRSLVYVCDLCFYGGCVVNIHFHIALGANTGPKNCIFKSGLADVFVLECSRNRSYGVYYCLSSDDCVP